MKSSSFSVLLAILIALLAVSASPATAQEVERLKAAITEADKEEVRLLQEELRLKQKRNAEIAERINKLKNEPGTAVAPPRPAPADLRPANISAASDPQTAESASASNSSADVVPRRIESTVVGDSAAQPPARGVQEPVNDIETVADPKCRTFPGAGSSPDELKQFSIFRQQLCALIEESKPTSAQPAQIRFARSSEELVRLIVAKTVVDTDSSKLLNARNFLLKAETARTDKQIGADSKSNGTTSIVSKGGIPAFFAFAVENGAATSSVDGTTMTFRLNPAGVLQTVTGSDYLDLFEERRKSPLLDVLGKTSLGFSFDTKRGFESPTFTGSDRQLSAFSLRYEFINERSPKHSRFRRLWSNFVKNPGEEFFNRQNALFEQIYLSDRPGQRGFKIPELQEWVTKVNAKLEERTADIRNLISQGKQAEATDLMEEIILAELETLPTTKLRTSPTFSAFVESIEADRDYVDSRNDLFDEIAKGQVATFEYINFREPIKPDTHSLRFIWEKGVWRGIDFTVNASLTFYNRKPNNPEVKRLRDFELSGQLDIPLRRAEMGFLKDSVISFAGKYQRLNTDIVSENGTLMPGTRGDIGIGQVKWTIPIGDTGLRLPVSFTFANRTELVKEREVRGNFGLTIDFDAILARFRSFSSFFPLR